MILPEGWRVLVWSYDPGGIERGAVDASGKMWADGQRLTGGPPGKDGKPDILRCMRFVEAAVRRADKEAP